MYLGRGFGSYACAFLAVLLNGAPGRAASAEPTAREVALLDATIRRVEFVDLQHGWAVGDRGLVLSTRDGGARWQQQQSGFDGTLYGVSFADLRHGWAVGGVVAPYTHTTRGVVLTTEDGGWTWRRVPTDTLPLLRHVRFFDFQRGVVAGASSALRPAGVALTKDAGLSWTTPSSPSPNTALAAAFSGPGRGTLAGGGGFLGAVTPAGVEPLPVLSQERRTPRAVAYASGDVVWLVGDGALVLVSTDGGVNWQLPTGTLPSGVEGFDWKSVAATGDEVRIVGSPGSVALASSDGGATWRLEPTGVTTPLESVCMPDPQHAWGAGALGTIVSTQDGGRSWTTQRSGGARCGVWGLARSFDRAPLHLVTDLAEAKGWLTAADLLEGSTTPDAEPRWTQAMVGVGAAVAGASLLPPQDSATDPPPAWRIDTLRTRLVLRMLSLRPDLVVLPEADPASGAGSSIESGADVIERTIREAIGLAADPAYVQRWQAAGLSPWRPKRIAESTAAEAPGALRVVLDDYQAELGTSLRLFAAPQRGQLLTRPRPTPRAYAVTIDGAGARTARHVADGLMQPRGSDSRRPNCAPATNRLAQLARFAQQTRLMEALLNEDEFRDWAGRVVHLTGGLEDAAGVELLSDLAQRYRARGDGDRAADTLYLMARRYPGHPIVEHATLHLLSYYSSGEIASANRPRPGKATSHPAGGPLANVSSSPLPPLPSGLAAGSPEAQPNAPMDDAERSRRADLLGTYLESARPDLFAEPTVRFPLAAAMRRLGSDRGDLLLQALAAQAVGDDWRRCARAEEWRQHTGRGEPEKPLARCLPLADRPLLDGVLDDPCWQAAVPISVGGTHPQPALVRLAYDNEYLLIGVESNKRAGVAYPAASSEARRHDSAGADRDRYRFRLDVDRDYSTAFQLTIDSRGWTADSCAGDPHWDPKWYVAASQSKDRWTAEAAIPWESLVAPKPRDVWALSIERRCPDHPALAWPAIAAPEHSPDRYGLVLFE